MNVDEQEALVSELEKDIDRLQALYNQYFMGIEKIEPLVQKKAVDRKINALRRMQIRRTAVRFRLQMQIQKYNTQSSYWRRVCRQIEEGTYTRHVMLAKRRVEARQTLRQIVANDNQERPSLLEELDESIPVHFVDVNNTEAETNSLLHTLGEQLDEPFAAGELVTPNETPAFNVIDDPFSETKKATESGNHSRSEVKSRVERMPRRKLPLPVADSRPARPVVPPMSPPAASAPERAGAASAVNAPRLDEQRAKSIYRTYLAARKKCSESIKGVSFEKLSDSLAKKYESSNGKVDFKVVIRQGKAVIKTVEKK